MKRIVLTENKFSGRHYAWQSLTSKWPFRNAMAACKSIELYKSDIVVDIGAYVGEYSLHAASRVREVHSYEASPETFKVLAMNRKSNMQIFNKAVIGGNDKTVELFLTGGIGAGNSIFKGRKKDSVTVEAVNYLETIRNATVVKIDVEGAEYDYDIIQPNLRAIIIEFHPISGKYTGAYQIMEDLQNKGFKPAYRIPQFKNGWDTNSAWIRR